MDHNDTKLLFENWNKFVEGLQQIDEAPKPPPIPAAARSVTSKKPPVRRSPSRDAAGRAAAAARSRANLRRTLPTATSGTGQAQRPTSGVQSRTPSSNVQAVENNIKSSESAIMAIDQLLKKSVTAKAGLNISEKQAAYIGGVSALGAIGISTSILTIELADYYNSKETSAEEKSQAAGISNKALNIADQKNNNLQALRRTVEELRRLQAEWDDTDLAKQINIKLKTKDLMDEVRHIEEALKDLNNDENKILLIAEKLLKLSLRRSPEAEEGQANPRELDQSDKPQRTRNRYRRMFELD